MTFRTLAFACPLLFVLACGGSSDPNEPPTGAPSGTSTPATQGSVDVPNVGPVRAVRVIDRRTADAAQVAAFEDQAKIEKVVALLGLTEDLPEATAFPNCIAEATVELFDAAGAVGGTVEVYCQASAILRVGDKAYSVTVSDLDALTRLEGDETLIANWVYDVSKVTIARPMEDTTRVLDQKRDIDSAISALSPVDSFDPDAPRTRCVADYAVTFTRIVGEGPPVETHLFITCGSDPKPSQPGWFQATDELGGQVTVNAQLIAMLAEPKTTPPSE